MIYVKEAMNIPVSKNIPVSIDSSYNPLSYMMTYKGPYRMIPSGGIYCPLQQAKPREEL